jgi:hypothetical protein
MYIGRGCSHDDMKRIEAEAREKRTPNAGDFEKLNQKLDRIIELLAAH